MNKEEERMFELYAVALVEYGIIRLQDGVEAVRRRYELPLWGG